MAEQGGSFAGFSSGVPTTGQMGQGLAQVFTPQAIGLDTTSVQRAGAAIGGALMQQSKAKSEADAKKRAVEAKKLKDRKSGIYNINQQAINTGLETLRNKYVNGEISYEDYMNQTDAYVENTKAINMFESNVIKPEQAKHIDDENAFILIPTGEGGASAEVKSYAEGTDWLSEGLDDTAQELIQQDPTLGLYNAYLQEKYQDVRKNFAQKDPDWSLGGTLLSDDSWSQFVAQADKNTQAKIGGYSDDYDKKQLVTQDEDIREAYKEYIKTQRPDIMGKWVKQKKFDEGLSNQYVSDVLFSQDYKPYVAQVFSEAVDEVILPSANRKTKEDFVRKPKKGDGSGDDDSTVGFELTTVTVSEPQERGQDPKAIDYKMWGAGDETIDGTKVSGVVWKNGKLLPKTVDFGVTDDESLAVNYINKKNASFSEGEKVSKKQVIDLLKETQSEERGFDEETFKAIDRAIDNFGGFRDNESGLYERLQQEFGFDFKNDDAFVEFRGIVSDINFDDAKDRSRAIRWLKENLPTTVTRANREEQDIRESGESKKPKFN